ncbi:MAG: DNA-binding protein, partial [Bacteroides acidifaciens]|nr:DNA-binding protein [Bacteroides acidifaciens]
HLMAEGRSVKIDGIGTFTPSLTLGSGKGREAAEDGGEHRSAQSIFIGGVNFRVDREMVRNISERCRLERAPWKKQKSSNKFTPEQRLALALKYLDKHPFLTVREYQKLTGLLQTAATNELRQWGHQPDSGIEIAGRGAHRVYIKKKTAEEGL